MLNNIPEERRSPPLAGGSLKLILSCSVNYQSITVPYAC